MREITANQDFKSQTLELASPGLSLLSFALFILTLLLYPIAQGQESAQADLRTALNGHWIINEDLSDNTDDKVEAAIKETGGRVQKRGWFSKKEDVYRGGPAEQELYDRISYDDMLTIAYNEPEFVFEYADQFKRVFHTDGRKRTTGVNAFFEEGGEDFSIANFDSNTLLVEARPRDGGYAMEIYTLLGDGNQLQVEMTIEPLSFGSSITLRRIYDRAATQ